MAGPLLTPPGDHCEDYDDYNDYNDHAEYEDAW